jgi:hypothetical protein
VWLSGKNGTNEGKYKVRLTTKAYKLSEEGVRKLNVGVLNEENTFLTFWDRLYALVIRVSGYRSKCPGSIPGGTRFSEKYWVWNGIHSVS